MCDPLAGRSWPSCLQSHSERQVVSQSADTCNKRGVSVCRPRTRVSVIVSRCLGYIWSCSSTPLACGQRKSVHSRRHHCEIISVQIRSTVVKFSIDISQLEVDSHVWDLSVWSLYLLPVSVWILSGFPSFLPPKICM